jgi:hypothetical protein
VSDIASNHIHRVECLDVSIHLTINLDIINLDTSRRLIPGPKLAMYREIQGLTQKDPFGLAIFGLHIDSIELCLPRFFQFSRSVDEYIYGASSASTSQHASVSDALRILTIASALPNPVERISAFDNPSTMCINFISFCISPYGTRYDPRCGKNASGNSQKKRKAREKHGESS